MADLGDVLDAGSEFEDSDVSLCSGIIPVDGNVVRLLCWNVSGLNSDKFFAIKGFLSNFDIVCLMETWRAGANATSFDLDGFSVFHSVDALRRANRGRRSGGFLIFVKKQVEPFITKIEVMQMNTIWYG